MATNLTIQVAPPSAAAISRYSHVESRSLACRPPVPPHSRYCHSRRPATVPLHALRAPRTQQPRRPTTVCQVSLVDDGPFVAAIATSIALSAAPLVLPTLPGLPLLPGKSKKNLEDSDDADADAAAAAAAALLAAGIGVGDGKGRGEAEGEEAEGGLSLGELRAGVMTVVSLIPFFNWLCWVLAWIDSRDVKYILFAAVYAAPYARGGLTLATDGNWLPMFSIAACVLHVQIDNVAVERRRLASKIKCAKKNSSNAPKGSLEGSNRKSIFPAESSKDKDGSHRK